MAQTVNDSTRLDHPDVGPETRALAEKPANAWAPPVYRPSDRGRRLPVDPARCRAYERAGYTSFNQCSHPARSGELDGASPAWCGFHDPAKAKAIAVQKAIDSDLWRATERRRERERLRARGAHDRMEQGRTDAVNLLAKLAEQQFILSPGDLLAVSDVLTRARGG